MCICIYTYIHTHIYIYIYYTYIYIYIHIYTNIHTCIHIYTQTYTHTRPGIGPHRNQANNLPQQNGWKTPAENSHAQWSCRSTACKFHKNFLPHRYSSPHPTKANHSPSPHKNQPSDRKGLTQSKLTRKHEHWNPLETIA